MKLSDICQYNLSFNLRSTFRGVIYAKVGCPVDDDALHRHSEALVKPLNAIRLGDPFQAVCKPIELAGGASLAYVSCQPGTGKIQRVDEAEGGGTSGTPGCQVTGEIAPELSVLVNSAQKYLLVLVLERKVEGLGREVADDVGHVASPEGRKALLLGNANEAVCNALVLHIRSDLFAGMLDLAMGEGRTRRSSFRWQLCQT